MLRFPPIISVGGPCALTQPLQSTLLYGLSDRRAVLVALTPGAPGRLSGAIGLLPVGWMYIMSVHHVCTCNGANPFSADTYSILRVAFPRPYRAFYLAGRSETWS